MVVTQPVATSHIAAAAASNGAAARKAASRKDEHYARFFPDDKALVSPLAIEFFGHMESDVETVLSHIAMLMVGVRKDTNPTALCASRAVVVQGSRFEVKVSLLNVRR